MFASFAAARGRKSLVGTHFLPRVPPPVARVRKICSGFCPFPHESAKTPQTARSNVQSKALGIKNPRTPADATTAMCAPF